MPAVVRSILFGAATGSRSQLPTALLVATIARGKRPTGSSFGARAGRSLSGRWAVAGFALGATGELVGDKLPKTPSRTLPPGVISRVVMAVVGGAVLGERTRSSQLINSVAAAGGALATTYGGARYRAAAAQKFGQDLPGALLEDTFAAGMASLSVRGL